MLPLESQNHDVDEDMILYNVSTRGVAHNLNKNGLPPNSQWVVAEEAFRLARLLEYAGQTPLMIPMPLASLNMFEPRPDYEIIGEINSGIMDGEQQRFFQFGQDTKASLKVYGSLRLTSYIPNTVLLHHYPHLREVANSTTRKERREEERMAKKTIKKHFKQV